MWLVGMSRFVAAGAELPPPAGGSAGVAANGLAIGGQRQLFIDDGVVDSLKDLARVAHPPQRHAGNPVLRGTESWEKWTVDVNGLTTLYDEEARQFRMWYVSALIDADSAYGELHCRMTI